MKYFIGLGIAIMLMRDTNSMWFVYVYCIVSLLQLIWDLGAKYVILQEETELD